MDLTLNKLIFSLAVRQLDNGYVFQMVDKYGLIHHRVAYDPYRVGNELPDDFLVALEDLVRAAQAKDEAAL